MSVLPVPNDRLAVLERVIERGKQTFIEVGQALAEIQEDRLYHKQGYATFEAYCKERWGWTRSIAYRYIDASEAAENVLPTIQNPPSLTQAFELARLEPEDQRELAASIDFSTATVADVRQAVREYRSLDPLLAPIEAPGREAERDRQTALIVLEQEEIGPPVAIPPAPDLHTPGLAAHVNAVAERRDPRTDGDLLTAQYEAIHRLNSIAKQLAHQAEEAPAVQGWDAASQVWAVQGAVSQIVASAYAIARSYNEALASEQKIRSIR